MVVPFFQRSQDKLGGETPIALEEATNQESSYGVCKLATFLTEGMSKASLGEDSQEGNSYLTFYSVIFLSYKNDEL